jgi:hypothetical protein
MGRTSTPENKKCVTFKHNNNCLLKHALYLLQQSIDLVSSRRFVEWPRYSCFCMRVGNVVSCLIKVYRVLIVPVVKEQVFGVICFCFCSDFVLRHVVLLHIAQSNLFYPIETKVYI